MGRTLLTTYQLAQNNYSVQPGDLAIAQASDFTNGNYFAPSGSDVLLVQNTDSVDHTFTVLSVADHLGRSVDLVYSVPANTFAAIEYSVFEGWIQSTGFIYLQPGHESVLFTVMRHQ